jgi:hypothetical protein
MDKLGSGDPRVKPNPLRHCREHSDVPELAAPGKSRHERQFRMRELPCNTGPASAIVRRHRRYRKTAAAVWAAGVAQW